MPRSPVLFEFESSDSLAQFLVWMAPLAGGGTIAVIGFDVGGMKAIAAVVAACLLLVVGLRSSITVHLECVVIKRKWFFIPYIKHTASCIEEVSFGGDYGLDEGAIGVVVTMGGREFHLGTSKNMHYLHEALTQVTYSGVKHAD